DRHASHGAVVPRGDARGIRELEVHGLSPALLQDQGGQAGPHEQRRQGHEHADVDERSLVRHLWPAWLWLDVCGHIRAGSFGLSFSPQMTKSWNTWLFSRYSTTCVLKSCRGAYDRKPAMSDCCFCRMPRMTFICEKKCSISSTCWSR